MSEDKSPADEQHLIHAEDAEVVIERHPTSQRRTRVRTNDLGLRGPAVPAREVGELRILVLGDSITFGDYVDEHETYPAELERRLKAAMPARVVRVHLLVAEGPHNQQRSRDHLAGHEVQQQQRRNIGPLQVIKDHE